MKNAVDGRVELVLVKVFGFGDAERHALNTVFRLSQDGPVGYTLWTDDMSGQAEVVLMDGESWEAGVELARPSFDAPRLIWVGDHAPAQTWKRFARPLRWNEVVEAMDQLFMGQAAAKSASTGVDLDLDFDALVSPRVSAAAMPLDIDFDIGTGHESEDESAVTQPQAGTHDDAVTAPAALEDTPARRSGPRVLLIDADRDNRLYLIAKFAAAQVFDIDQAGGSADALALASSQRYQIVVLDLGLNETRSTAWKLLRQLQRTGQAAQFIVTSERVNLLTRLRGWLAGVGPVVSKPFHPARLMRRIEAAKRGAG